MVVNIILMIFLVGLSGFFIIGLMASGKYNQYIEPLGQKEFPLRELFGFGFFSVHFFKLKLDGKYIRRLRDNLDVIYGRKYANYYLNVYIARNITWIYLSVCAGCTILQMAKREDKVVIGMLVLAVVAAITHHCLTDVESKMKKQREKYLTEFPNAVSTIALLVNSGMILVEAWREVAYSREGPLYDEMKLVCVNIDNGMSEKDALFLFGNRCATSEIRKFVSSILQSLDKGNKDLERDLKKQSSILWEEKRQDVLRRGELAASKLLIPIMIMFVGVLIMVAVPIMTNLM